jgi:hypothetical protein
MAKKSQPLRIEEEALKLVRIAAGFTGEQPTEYASRVLAQQAQIDIEKGYKELHQQGQTPKPKGRPDSKN